MLPVLQKLLILQERDEKLSALRGLDRMPVEEKALEDQWQAASHRLNHLKETHRQLEVDRKKLELEIGSKQEQIGRYKTQQLQTRNNDEFSALNHQIAHAEKEVVTIEDKELVGMERASELEKQIAAEEAALKVQEGKVAEKRAVFRERRARLEEEAAKVSAQQAAVEQEVEAAQEGILSRYRRILQSKKRQAVVPVTHGSCAGCHMKLTAQTVVAVTKAQEVVACENCGRLLYSGE